MATFYVGKRPVLRGRRDSDFSFTEKTKTLSGKTRSAVGTYSRYTLFGPGVLTGAPDNDHTPGTGYSPHGLFLTRYFRGLDTKGALDGPGSGARLTGARYRPLEYKGLSVAAALADSSLGHARRVTSYSQYDNFTFDGVTSAEALKAPGHAIRAIGASGTAASFGYFDPYGYKGTTTQALSGATQAYPTTFDHAYGKNRVNEWRGLPGSKAL